MKNYKLLVPIVLVVLFLGSIYMLSDIKKTEQNKYDQILFTARDYREKDIQIDAEEYYMQAASLRPTVELYVEIGQFYWETEQVKNAMDWGAGITKTFPKEPLGYEFLMDIYNQQEDYIACFRLAETFRKRQLKSEKVDAILSALEYEYYFNGEFHGVAAYSEGLCPIQIDGKWGYADDVGDRIISATYQYAGPFSEGMAPITDREGNCYFIDYSGNKKHVVLGVSDIKQLGPMESGLFSLYDGQKWHFYNTDHQKVFGDYDAVSAMANGIAAVKTGSSWQLVNHAGEDLSGSTYAAVAADEKGVVYRDERLFVSDGTSWRMIDYSGNIIGNDTYEDVRVFADTTYAAVKKNGKWGFVDKTGAEVIAPQFEDARSFVNGMAAVQKDGLWGYINPEGNIVIDAQFENALDFNSAGGAFVFMEGEWNLLRLYKYNY